MRPRGFSNPGFQVGRVRRREDDPVCALLQCFGKQLEISFAKPRIAAELKFNGRLKGLSGLFNAFLHRLKKTRDLLGQMNRNTDFSFQLQMAGGDIRLVPERLRHLKHFGSREGIDAGAAVQRAIHSADGDANGLSNVFDTW
jgi:hypothetical protein